MAELQQFTRFNQKVSFGTVDNALPTFGGITGLTANPNGALTVSWSAATDVSLPISYKIYIKAGNATGLFTPTYLALSSFALSHMLYHLPDDSCLVEGVTYHVGVRAVDSAGNETTNTETLSEVSTGVYTDSIATAINALTADTLAIRNAANMVLSTVS